VRRRPGNASVTVDILRLCKVGEIDRNTQPTTFVQCFAERDAAMIGQRQSSRSGALSGSMMNPSGGLIGQAKQILGNHHGLLLRHCASLKGFCPIIGYGKTGNFN